MLVFKFLTILSWLYLYRAEDELIAVTALIRHGARIPISFYPTDPYKNVTWPFALGDLTNKGIEEMYDVGKWLRKKYSSFLSEIHTTSEIYAHSVDLDRCYMTAEATLAGLYPAKGNQVWNSNIRWQSVPIHGTANSQNIATNTLSAPCSKKLKAVAKLIYNLPEYPASTELYKPILEYISERAGENITLPKLFSFYDTIFSEKQLGLPLPKWVSEVYPKIQPLIELYTKINSIRPQEVIWIGPSMTQILNQFERAITGEGFGNGKTIYRKFMAYFSTEWILYDFAYGLGLESIDIPQYGALFLIELRRNWKGHYVKILYRNSSKPGTKAIPWRFKEYGFNPSFRQFRKNFEPFRTNTTEWVSLCHEFAGVLPKTIAGVPMY